MARSRAAAVAASRVGKPDSRAASLMRPPTPDPAVDSVCTPILARSHPDCHRTTPDGGNGLGRGALDESNGQETQPACPCSSPGAVRATQVRVALTAPGVRITTG